MVNSPDQDSQHEEIEYVGAPTEFAEAQEAPEWVTMVAKLLFFLPAALVTATTIPFILLGLLLMCFLLVACWLSVLI